MAKPNFHPVNKDGLVFWSGYRLTGSVSALGTVRDYSGSGNDGTCEGTTFVDNHGMTFGAFGDCISIPDSSTLQFDNVSVSFWLNLTGLNNGFALAFCKASPTSIFFIQATASTVEVFSDNPTGLIETINILGAGWTHIAFTRYREGTTAYRKLYINGLPVKSDSVTAVSIANNDQMLLGDYFDRRYSLGGRMDNVQIYNRALSAGEIKRNYERNKKS